MTAAWRTNTLITGKVTVNEFIQPLGPHARTYELAFASSGKSNLAEALKPLKQPLVTDRRATTS